MFTKVYSNSAFFFLFYFILTLLPVHAEETIDISAMFPEQILELKVAESKEERTNVSYTFTKRYGGECPVACIRIHLAQDTRRQPEYFSKEKWQVAVNREAPRVRKISSGGWTSSDKQDEGFPVGLFGNWPGAELSAGFRFYIFSCYVEAYGKYATFEYLDEALRFILKRIGWL
ncbi:MAG: hypothetical protein AB1478_08285 [Nitrospirota bacterium]